MLLKDFLIGVLIFGVIITAFGAIFTDVRGTYNITVSEEYNQTYENIESTMAELRDNADAIRNETRPLQADEDDQFGGSLIKGAFNSLRLVWNSWDTVKDTAQIAQDDLGVPPEMILAFLSIIIISISFAIISAVFKHPL